MNAIKSLIGRMENIIWRKRGNNMNENENSMTNKNNSLWNNGNSGFWNNGYRNSGNYNNGDYNNGSFNNGNYNSGSFNSGDRNSGDYNVGDLNGGFCNNGYGNHGNNNSGNFNRGHHNSGNCNSGDDNTGNRNAGDYNLSNGPENCFCTEPHKMRFFDKETDMTFAEWRESEAYKLLLLAHTYPVKWVEYPDMTEQEKQEHPESKVTNGYVKKVDVKAAYGEWWAGLDKRKRNVIRAMPNFDAAKFERITGIKA